MLMRLTSSGRAVTPDETAAPEGAVAGMENPTTADVGSLDLDEDASAGCCRRDAQDFFGADFATAGGAGTMAGAAAVTGSVAVEVSVTAALTSSLTRAGSSLDGSRDLLSEASRDFDAGEGAVRETDVLVDRGDPGTGVSGAVEHTDVVSVAEDDNASACSDSGDGVSLASWRVKWPATPSDTKATTFGFNLGEAAGLGSCNAFWMT